ncbi:reverse transcriptase domain-containing protein [Tanacetum coccineum]|uniref:Reverse transcriptase domain-containing protein n=1 Tax=Tanacetum coccineum TaxID=301880 RepID=A0ABQ4ZSK8_9ASTR
MILVFTKMNSGIEERHHGYTTQPFTSIQVSLKIYVSHLTRRLTRPLLTSHSENADIEEDLRGDQGLYTSKNSTRSLREITLNLLLYLIVHKQLLSWFRWISFDYHVTLGFGSIAGGLDHANPVIRLPIEHGISSGTKAPGVVKPEIRGNVNFQIKSQFMRELREDTFSGNKNEDAHDHVDRVLNIVSLFNIPGVSQDAVLLRVFLFTLTGSTKRWVDKLTPGAVNTWDLLKKAFIQRYCPPSKTAKRLEDIYNFKQESDESLYQAGMWHDGTSNRKVSSNSNTDGLAAIVSILDNLGRDIKKLKENVHVIQVGCQICKGPHLDKECPLNEDVKQVEEVKYGEFGRPAPFNGSNGAKFCVGPPTTNGAPSSSTEQCKVVNVDHETPNMLNSSSKLNNLHRVSDAQMDQNKEERATKFYGMADLGASLNVMPRNTFEYLRLANMRSTNILVEMADMTKKAPLGIDNARVSYDMEKKDHTFTTPTKKIFMIKSDLENRPQSPACSDNQSRNLPDRSPDDSLHNQGRMGLSFLDYLLAKYGKYQNNSLVWGDRYAEWCNVSPTLGTSSQESKNLRPRDYTFKEWTLIKVGHTDISKPVKKALLKLWLIDCFQDESGIVKNPLSRNSTYWWHDHGFEEEERDEMGIEIEKYDPPKVQVETFEVRKYSFKGGQKFVCVTKKVDDALPLGRRNGSRFKEMIRKEFDINAHNKT